MKRFIFFLLVFHLFTAIIFLSCAPKIPKEALQLTPEDLRNRQLQTRYFDTDEKTLLSASAGVLQDLGFTIDESETDLGVIACSKTRDATNAGQVVAAILIAAFIDAPASYDKEQLIRASLVTHPILVDEPDSLKRRTAVRVTFQRIITNNQGRTTKRECIIEPQIYEEFFEKLSKSLFLEAHEI